MSAILSFTTDLLLPFLVVITVLVFVHELGHYLVARWNGVKIEAFSVGMGPEIFGFNDRHATRWKFCIFPIGGYVKMFGDADPFSRPAKETAVESSSPVAQQATQTAQGQAAAQATQATPQVARVAEAQHTTQHATQHATQQGQELNKTQSWAGGTLRTMSDEERSLSFHHKRVGQRFAIVLAGPMANFIFTIAVLFGMLLFIGQAMTPPVIGEVVPDSPAQAAGLQAGDRILSVDGTPVERFQDLQRIVQITLDREMLFVIERNGNQLSVPLVPAFVEVEDITGRTIRTPRIGIAASGTEFVKLSIPAAAVGSVQETWEIGMLTLRAVGQIITGRRGTEELGGPIRIAELSGKMAEGGAPSLLWFMAVLSLNLGLINLFPIPVLDGGHLVFYSYEWLRGKPMPIKAQEIGYRIGLALILALFVFVFWNDLSHYWAG